MIHPKQASSDAWDNSLVSSKNLITLQSGGKDLLTRYSVMTSLLAADATSNGGVIRPPAYQNPRFSMTKEQPLVQPTCSNLLKPETDSIMIKRIT